MPCGDRRSRLHPAREIVVAATRVLGRSDRGRPRTVREITGSRGLDSGPLGGRLVPRGFAVVVLGTEVVAWGGAVITWPRTANARACGTLAAGRLARNRRPGRRLTRG